jgi:hypothetical protein
VPRLSFSREESGSVGLHSLLQHFMLDNILKVLTNEKRGGLTVVSFDRSPFKLFLL